MNLIKIMLKLIEKKFFIKKMIHKKQKTLTKYKYSLIIFFVFIIFFLISYDSKSNEFLFNNTYQLILQTTQNSKCNQTISQK